MLVWEMKGAMQTMHVMLSVPLMLSFKKADRPNSEVTCSIFIPSMLSRVCWPGRPFPVATELSLLHSHP